MTLKNDLGKWFQKEKKKIVEDYTKFLSFPSISTDSKYKKDMQECASWLSSYLQKMDFSSEIIPTKKYPLVFASSKPFLPGAPTLLIYGHYDVQPVDPLREWKTPPFNPTFVGEKVFARGAADNKGQLFYTLNGLRAYKDIKKSYPLNIKLLLEGEEESASVGLSSSLSKIAKKIACDFILVPDVDIPSMDKPAITVSTRGITTLEIELTSSKRDLHSGHYGGMVYNPNRALAEILSKAFNKKGKIQIPGFFKGIKPFSPKEKKEIDLALSIQKELKNLQITPLDGKGLVESIWLNPSFEINGISGGYAGEGFKTVIPAKSVAKISSRLVYNQNPKQVFTAIVDFFKKNLPPHVNMKTTYQGGGSAVKSNLSSFLIKALQSSYEQVFQKKVRFIGSGGSIPVIAEVVKATKADVAFMGVSLDSDNIHAPNENFDMDRFEKGLLIIANLVEQFQGHA